MQVSTPAVLAGTLAATLLLGLCGCHGDQSMSGRQHGPTHAQMKMVNPERVEWREGPESLPAGAQFAVLEGDPARSGLFTMRLKLPAGYRIPPHTHPRVERVTVLSGTARLGMGSTFDEAALEALPAGSFFTMPPGMQHFAAAGDAETVIQLTGEGPWKIVYVNPEDDPRRTQR